ncbi:MAG: iron ABC transporter permease [Acidobacteria bacterium]|nr:iron ABC transporter permease [Acidobacteriota bacterium]
MKARAILLTSAALLLVGIGLAPVLVILVRSLLLEGQVGLPYLQRMGESQRVWTLFGHSAAVSGLTTLITVAAGLPLGILLGRSDLPLRRALTFLFTIPLLVPPYIIAVLWFYVLGRRGLAARVFGARFAEASSDWYFGLPGCVLVLSTVFLPVVVLLVIIFLNTVNPRFEEAARMVSGWAGVLRGVSIPLILPGVLLSAILVFLLSFGEFGVPMYLRYDVFPVEAFTQFSAFFDFGAAAAASLPLVIVTLGVLAVERVFLRDRTYTLRPIAPADGRLELSLGAARWWAFLLAGMLGALAVGLPLTTLGWNASSPAAIREALDRGGDSLLRSLCYAGFGAAFVTLVGFLLGYLIHSRALSFWRSADSITVFLFALPSTVVGIGLVAIWNHPATGFIYATPAIVLFGYFAQYAALTSRISVSALAQIPSGMEEAAQVVGARWPRRMVSIVAPLAWRGIAGGWVVAYIFCLRDTGISMMVYPPGHDTLPVRIFTLMANGSTELISALCLLMCAAAVAPPILAGLGFLYSARRRRA